MSHGVAARIVDHFAELTDARDQSRVVHPLINLVTIALCAVISGADDFVAITVWANEKRAWLARFLDLSKGIPSHDRFSAVFAQIKPAEFEKCFLKWITALHEITAGQLVAIDGKTLRRSFDAATSKAPLHMVSAWAAANHVCLGQVATDEKSNEITAIPKLLELLELSGCLVTIDAMGCQTDIAAAIVDAGADYVLAVKANQPTLHDGIVDHFVEHLEDDFARTKVNCHTNHEKAHGRQTKREYFVCVAPDDLPDRKRWRKLSAIGMTINHTTTNGEDSSEVRVYILSRKLSGKQFAAAVRGHWSIENSLHWQLDVTFGEDLSRIRKGHADANFSLVRRAALSLLKNNHGKKVGVKNKRLIASASDDYRMEVLFGA